MGFYPPDLLVHEAQRRGIEVLPPCGQRSAVECRAEALGKDLPAGADESPPSSAGAADPAPSAPAAAPRATTLAGAGSAPARSAGSAPASSRPPRSGARPRLVVLRSSDTAA